jgi:predicted deacylase
MSGAQINARVPLMGWLSSPLRWVKLLLELRDVPSGKFRSGALDFIERDLRVLDLHPDQQARVLLLARCVRDRADCEKVLSGLCVSKTKFEDFP